MGGNLHATGRNPEEMLIVQYTQRINAILTWPFRKRLQERADYEGRSLSGLIAYTLERSTAS